MSELKQIKRHHERQLKNMDKKLTMYQIHPEDVSWLVKRVEELEKREGVYKEVTQSYSRVLDGFIDDIERLEQKNKRLCEAIIEAIADIEAISPHEAKKTLREALEGDNE